MARPARVVIDLPAARSNLQTVKRCAPNQKVMAIIKADAYGHGLERIANALTEADAFGVACLEEAIRLRDSGISQPIILLEGFFDQQELQQLADLGIQTIVHQHTQVAMLEQLAAERAVYCWLKIDTGMHRLGVEPRDVASLYMRLKQASGARDPIRLMSHFASAQEEDEDSIESVKGQLNSFFETTSGLEGEHCLANSAAIIDWPLSYGDWVRPGLMLYGISPFKNRNATDLDLKPVMSLESELISVKRAVKGERVGYGGTWICPEDMPIGVIAMGYGDGYPRHAASGTPMLINGHKARLIGRPSMDMLTVDLRQCPDARIGDTVLLWGNDLPVEEIARCAETIAYELLCGMRLRARFVVLDH